MTMDEPDTSPDRRPRSGESGAPVGSILSIVLAVAAVLIGLFILNQINDDDDGVTAPSGNGQPDETTDETDGTNGTGGTGDTNAPASTAPVNVREGARVVVANANTTGGSASQMSDQLESAGFTMGAAIDAAGAERQLDETKVYFEGGNARARDVASTVARLMGGVEVAEMPAEIPVEGGQIDGKVLVMLGVDAVGEQLSDLTGN